MEELKKKEDAAIIRQEEIAPGIFSLWIKSNAAEYAKPGQFANIFIKDEAHLLGRPLSICQIDKSDLSLRFVYQKKGFGTGSLSELSSGDIISIMAPLGNGFPELDMNRTTLLIGGGLGIAPLLGLAGELKNKALAVLGYKDAPFLVEDFLNAGAKVIIATESGMSGVKGTVIDALKGEDVSSLKACVCGPMPMLKAVKAYSEEKSIETYISLEAKMACGIGACLGCVTNSTEKSDKYNVNRLCVCKDGPVFKATEVQL